MRRARIETVLGAMTLLFLSAVAASITFVPAEQVHAWVYTLVREVPVGYNLTSPLINATQATVVGGRVVLLGSSSGGRYIIELRINSSTVSIARTVRIETTYSPFIEAGPGLLYLAWSSGSSLVILELNATTLQPLSNVSIPISRPFRGLGVNGSYVYILLQDVGPAIEKVGLSGSVYWGREILYAVYGETRYSLGSSALVANGSSIYVGGDCTEGLISTPCAYVARILPNGSVAWLEVFSLRKLLSIAVNGSRIYVLMRLLGQSGTEESYVDLAALSPNGSVLWVDRLYSATGLYEPRMAVSGSAIYVAGDNVSLYVAKISPSGTPLRTLSLCSSSLGLCMTQLGTIVALPSRFLVVGSTRALWSNDLVYDTRFGTPTNVSIGPETSLFHVLIPPSGVGTASVSLVGEPQSVSVSPSGIEPVSASFSPIYVHVKLEVYTKQPSPTSPQMSIVIRSDAPSYAPSRSMVVAPRSTGVMSLGIEGTLITVRGTLVIYSPTKVLGYSVGGSVVKLSLESKGILSVAAPRGVVRKVIVVYSNGTRTTLCASPSGCDSLRDSMGTMDLDPTTVDIYVPPPPSVGAPPGGAVFGGSAASMAPLLSVLVALALVPLLAAAVRRLCGRGAR